MDGEGLQYVAYAERVFPREQGVTEGRRKSAAEQNDKGDAECFHGSSWGGGLTERRSAAGMVSAREAD